MDLPEPVQTYFSTHLSGVFHTDAADIPPEGVAYALIVVLEDAVEIGFGRRGAAWFPAGCYGYGGSAHGPGGGRARLGRHFRRGKPYRWHIDRLTEAGRFAGAWTSREMSECDIVRLMRHLPGAQSGPPGFGASDCRACDSHLVFLGPR